MLSGKWERHLHGVGLFSGCPLPGVMVNDSNDVFSRHNLHGRLSSHKGIPPLHMTRGMTGQAGDCLSQRCRCQCRAASEPLTRHTLYDAQTRKNFCKRRVTPFRLCLPTCLTHVWSQEATHRLGAVHHTLKQEGGRLSVILCHQAAVCCDRCQLVCKDPLIERDQIAVPCCFAKAGKF